VKGASKGEGLGNEFLGHIRSVDALVQVVRDFDDANVVRAGSQDPEYDISVVQTELILADYQAVEKNLAILKRGSRTTMDKQITQKMAILEKLLDCLSKGLLASESGISEDEAALVSDTGLLTLKPMFYVYNVDENMLKEKSQIDTPDKIHISAKVEAELADFSGEEKQGYLKSLGVTESGLDKVIKLVIRSLISAPF